MLAVFNQLEDVVRVGAEEHFRGARFFMAFEEHSSRFGLGDGKRFFVFNTPFTNKEFHLPL